MKTRSVYFWGCFITLCSFAYTQNVEGTYEWSNPDRNKEVITISAHNKFKEIDYKMYNGAWKYKCTYEGVWSVSGDTLTTKSNKVVWYNGDTTLCRPQDDSKQPMCCFSRKFFYNENSIWIFGEMSGTKYIYTKQK